MKDQARIYVWQPRTTADIEEAVQGCTECQLNQSTQPDTPLHPWSWLLKMWTKQQLDNGGPVYGRVFLIPLILTDAHS